jgi:hypothetical protein
MIIKPGQTKIIYVGKKNGEIRYVGRGYISRAIGLMEGNHHIIDEFDEIEVLGPMSHEESVALEKKMILEHCPPLNNIHNREKHPLHGYVPTGIPRGRPKGPDEKSQLIIDELLDSGLPQAAIARKYGISRQAVNNVKQRYINS